MSLVLHDGKIVYQHVLAGSWVTLPNGDKVSPAQNGWTDGTYFLTELVETTQPEFDAQLQTISLSVELVDGVPRKVWTITDLPPEEVETNRINAIKEACRQLIYKVAGDEEDQRNQSATFNVLNRREAAGAITKDELTELDRLDQLVRWVNEMRGVCKQAILNSETVDNVAWPEL